MLLFTEVFGFERETKSYAGKNFCPHSKKVPFFNGKLNTREDRVFNFVHENEFPT